MRKIVFFITCMVPFFIQGQTIKPDPDYKSSYLDQPSYLIDTVAISSLNKTQLFSNVNNYVTTFFKDSRAVIEMKDADLGEMVFSGNLITQYVDTLVEQKRKRADTTLIPLKSRLYFKAHVYVKDQKFKIVLSALETPMSPIIPDIKLTLKLIDPRPADKAAISSSISLIKEMTGFINRKPESDF